MIEREETFLVFRSSSGKIVDAFDPGFKAPTHKILLYIRGGVRRDALEITDWI